MALVPSIDGPRAATAPATAGYEEIDKRGGSSEWIEFHLRCTLVLQKPDFAANGLREKIRMGNSSIS